MGRFMELLHRRWATTLWLWSVRTLAYMPGGQFPNGRRKSWISRKTRTTRLIPFSVTCVAAMGAQHAKTGDGSLPRIIHLEEHASTRDAVTPSLRHMLQCTVRMTAPLPMHDRERPLEIQAPTGMLGLFFQTMLRWISH